MTRIHLHIGMDAAGTARLQQVMADKREQMLAKGLLFPRTAGARNHTRLFMAVTDPDNVDALRVSRGFADPVKQAALRAELCADLARDIATHQPRAVILSAHQLGTALARPSELERLRAMLAPLCTDIRIIAHVDAPSHMLARHYAAQVMIGRTGSGTRAGGAGLVGRRVGAGGVLHAQNRPLCRDPGTAVLAGLRAARRALGRGVRRRCRDVAPL